MAYTIPPPASHKQGPPEREKLEIEHLNYQSENALSALVAAAVLSD